MMPFVTSINLIQDFFLKSQYSNEGKDNLKTSILNYMRSHKADAEGIFTNVVSILQPNKIVDVINLYPGPGNKMTDGFEMEVGPIVLYMEKTTFLKEKFNKNKDPSK